MAAVTIECPAVEAHTDEIDNQLIAYNRQFIPPSNSELFNVVLRDEGGTLIGGAICFVKWNWLCVEDLWVSEACRGQGHGRTLMEAAERFGVEKGCTNSRLDTATFQARPFYEKLGYTVFGTIHDYPPGHSVFYMQKSLTTSTPD
jgi:GNAT superfamily N-acetyltransferase